MLRIITDTASDITKEQADKMNIEIVPLAITFEDGDCPQVEEKDFVIFYERLQKCQKLPTTSRPTPEAYLKIYEEAKSKGEEVLVLTLSGGLSGTIETAFTAKQMGEYENVHIVDTHQAIIAQRMIVEYAVKLRDEGYKAKDIAEKIEECRDRIVVCGVVDTLKYLKIGGRVPASLATIGEALRIKPVIVLEDTILKTIGKARGRKDGISKLYSKVEKDGIDTNYPVYFGYTTNKEIVDDFMYVTCKKYNLKDTKIYPVGGIIGTHCGTNCIAIAYMKK